MLHNASGSPKPLSAIESEDLIRLSHPGPDLFHSGDADLRDDAWVKTRSSIAEQTQAGPKGTTACYIIEDRSDGTHDFRRSVEKCRRPTYYLFSCFAKAGDRFHATIWLHGEKSVNRDKAGFDL